MTFSVVFDGKIFAIIFLLSPGFNVIEYLSKLILVIDVITVTEQVILFPFSVVAVITELPLFIAVRFPLLSTFTTPVLLLVHVIPVYISDVSGLAEALNFAVLL